MHRALRLERVEGSRRHADLPTAAVRDKERQIDCVLTKHVCIGGRTHRITHARRWRTAGQYIVDGLHEQPKDFFISIAEINDAAVAPLIKRYVSRLFYELLHSRDSKITTTDRRACHSLLRMR